MQNMVGVVPNAVNKFLFHTFNKRMCKGLYRCSREWEFYRKGTK